MSASRTLIRKLKVVRDRLSDPQNRRIKPGTPNRRVVELITDPRTGRGVPDSVEMTYHATKGYRRLRIAQGGL